MILYTLKTALIIAILLSFYLLFLEKEKMHRFNRFYLLVGLVFAIAIPFITVGTVPVNAGTPMVNTPSQVIVPAIVESIESTQSKNYMDWIWMVYAAISALILFRLCFNLSRIIDKIIKNPKLKIASNNIVLLNEEIVPYTFLNYMFVNADEYEKGAIDEQLYTHEFTHANQWHSLDILLIELITVFHWFNPLLYFYKKAIQLNHEFLADQEVNRRHNTMVKYQNLLLEKSSLNSGGVLSSNFNFQITKKRLIMMTKDSSKIKKLACSILVSPLIAIIISCFGEYQMKHSPELIQKGDDLISVDFRGMTEDQIDVVQEKLTELDIHLIYMEEVYTEAGLIKKLSFEVKFPNGNRGTANSTLIEMPVPFGFYYDLENGSSGTGGTDRGLYLFKKRTIKTAQEIKNLSGKFIINGQDMNYEEAYYWIQNADHSFQSTVNWGSDDDWDAKIILNSY